MITIECDRTAGAIQSIAARVLGQQVSVTQAGRLGNEITFADLDAATLDALRQALSAGGHRVYVTRDDLLDSEGVSRLLGIAVGSVARYRSRGDLPEPDVMLGRSPGWYAATIRDWQATRPGRTGRPRQR